MCSTEGMVSQKQLPFRQLFLLFFDYFNKAIEDFEDLKEWRQISFTLKGYKLNYGLILLCKALCTLLLDL